MLSSALNQGYRLASWKITPMRRGSGLGIGLPWQRIVPRLCARSPASIISSEVLPQPLGPTITTKRPLRTLIEMFSSAGTAPCAPA